MTLRVICLIVGLLALTPVAPAAARPTAVVACYRNPGEQSPMYTREANWVGVRPTGDPHAPFVVVAGGTPVELAFPPPGVAAAPAYDVRVEYRGWLFVYGDEKLGFMPEIDVELRPFVMHYLGINASGAAVLATAVLAPLLAFLLARRRSRHLVRALAQTVHDRDNLAASKVLKGELPSLPGRAVHSAHGRAFDVLRPLGNGNMGAVFEARCGTELWALKVPFRKALDEPGDRARFLREAEICAAIPHPGLVQVYDWGCFEADDVPDWPFLVMERLQGRTLRDELDGLDGKGLPLRRAVQWMREMGRALARLHEGGVVHRDLKPENVFVTSAGHVKIGDFGVAGRVTRHSLTRTGDAFGTPLYMSPEHLEARLVTPASDVYSLGIVFYEMLTGICPFAADTPVGIVHLMLTHTPEEASLVRPQVPRAWSEAVRDMMSRDPDGRPSLAQVVERLDAADA